ncbi:MAG: TIGR01212 family radical SAM protein [Ruminococcaceae bacterium]|nr:TIGR01212 family radical SAM protein [Oscillospiraceae bacterium]
MRYRSLNEELKRIFGCKVYKISLSANMSCPNRDGTKGYGGCIFCNGSGDFSTVKKTSILKQIDESILRVEHKNRGGKYIAYFQSGTNTYASVQKLSAIFRKAISHPEVVALSIGTRPDCLPDNVIRLLERLNRIKPVWVELGLQTIHESTAKYINRGYSLQEYEIAVKKLKNAGITVVTHMIIGLPFETKEMIVQTSRYIGELGSDGIKYHLLHVLSDTKLCDEYKKGVFDVLSMDEYIEILGECIKVIPPNVVIHRLTGDGDKKKLVAPLWSGNKKNVLNRINEAFEREGIIQGALC